MIKMTLGLLVLMLACGCSTQSSPSVTAPSEVVTTIQYTINIPFQLTAQELQRQFPHGVDMAPIQAQVTWNYTAEYRGAPNVYWGPVPPPAETYQNTGIVVAPVAVAQQLFFLPSEWPGISLAGDKVTWKGWFVFTRAAS